MSDYSRFATKPKDQIISQVVIVPILGIMTTVIGIICTSTAAQFYPDRGLLWEPYALLRAIQEEGGAGGRAAVFFACTSFPDFIALLMVSIRILDCSVWDQYRW
jgi:NCS1 family nucleobase:cation symporter-1